MRRHGAGSGSVVKPGWYSHGINRLAYYRMARPVAAALPRLVVAALERAVRAHTTLWLNFSDEWAPPIAAA